MHEQVATRDICAALVEQEPELAEDVSFGVAVSLLMDELLAEHVLGCFGAGPLAALARATGRSTDARSGVSGTVRLGDGDAVAGDDGAVVRACPGGPWLVRGADAVATRTAPCTPRPARWSRSAPASKTQRAPWCDGTHKVIPAAARR